MAGARPLHQRDRDAAARGGDGPDHVRVAERVGQAVHLQVELVAVDAAGCVHRQHQLERDLAGRRRTRDRDGKRAEHSSHPRPHET